MKTEPEINSWSSLASTLGTTDRTLRSWRKLKGSPRGCRQVTAWKAFMEKHGLGNRSKAARNPALEELKAEKMRLQTRVIALQEERQKLKNAVARGEFIPIDKAREDFSKCYGPMILHLKGTRHRTGQMVVGLDSGAAAKVVASDMNESLEKFTIPEHLRRDPFWRKVSESFEAHKLRNGKI